MPQPSVVVLQVASVVLEVAIKGQPSVVAIPLVAFHRSTATERVIRSAKLSVKEPGEHSVSEA